jgi:hypothetical protein
MLWDSWEERFLEIGLFIHNITSLPPRKTVQMAKDRERAINPAAAQRKAEKQRALKKGACGPFHSMIAFILTAAQAKLLCRHREMRD